MPLLLVDDVHKTFGSHAALQGMSLAVGHGEIVALLGASGSGKTTLLRMVAGLERIDRGRIVLDGVTVDAPGQQPLPPQQRSLGMVFQDYALWPHLSALGNVELPLRARGLADARQQAQRMLERVGLGALGARRPHQMSGGQQQRVALARALAVRPRLLLCDEPLSNLDAALRDELRDLIKNVAREHGVAVLYITHDQREALALADRVGIVERGRLLQIDTPHLLLQKPDSAAVAAFLKLYGPWPVHSDAGTMKTPWGATLADAAAQQVYLRGSALRVADPAAPGAVRARVTDSIETADGCELGCELHGVGIRFSSPTRLDPGFDVHLLIDTGQALTYPLNLS
ncbi:MAG: ABC transporter ATP-binding protein [Burkholderiales bacterium]|nr:ABC transporter ATP-binding protein [Burkholderiales bacterium]